jgi:hypothetical protein
MFVGSRQIEINGAHFMDQIMAQVGSEKAAQALAVTWCAKGGLGRADNQVLGRILFSDFR